MVRWQRKLALPFAIDDRQGDEEKMAETRLDDVVDALRERILAGEFGTGRLPTMRELAAHYSASRETVARAIKLLQAEGLLVSSGRSVYVQSQTRLPGGVADRLDLLLQQQGLPSEEAVLEGPASIDATGKVARVLQVAEGTPVVHLLRRQGTTTSPYRLVEEFYPISLAGGDILARAQAEQSPDILNAIRKKHGREARRIHEDIITRVPTSREQRQLSIAGTMPVIEMHRFGRDSDGTPIMLHRIVFVGSLFTFSYEYETNYGNRQKNG